MHYTKTKRPTVRVVAERRIRVEAELPSRLSVCPSVAGGGIASFEHDLVEETRVGVVVERF